MNRSALVAGPAKLVFAGATVFSKDDINIRIDQETFEVRTSVHGKVDERVRDVAAVATLTPEGRFTAALISALWPYANATCGASIYTDTDRPAVFHGSDGTLTTLKAAAVTKMPPLKFSAVDTLVGQAEITGVRGNNLDWDDADSLVVLAGTGGSTADATFAPSLIKTQPYFLNLTDGTDPIAGFQDVDCEDGFLFEPEVELQDIVIDRIGLVDKKFISVGAMVKCKPVGPAMGQILSALKVQGSGASRGRSLGGFVLTIKGADAVTYLTLPSCALKTAGYRFGTTVLRNDEIGFVAQRTFDAGIAQPLFTLAAS